MRVPTLIVAIVVFSHSAFAQAPTPPSASSAPRVDGRWDDKLINLPGSPLTFELRTDLPDGQLGAHLSRYGLKNRSSKTVALYRLGCGMVANGRLRLILNTHGTPVGPEGFPPGHFAQDALDFVKGGDEVGVSTLEDVAEYRGYVGGFNGCEAAAIMVVEVHFTDRTSWYANPTGHYVDHKTGVATPGDSR